MATEKDITAAKIIYNGVKDTLDNMGWTYDEYESELKIVTGAGGKDISIDIGIYVDAEKHIVTVLSRLPIDVPKDLRIDLSFAVSLINDHIVDGSFDYNVLDGSICFRTVVAYHDCSLSNEVFNYMIYITCRTVDDYNGMLNKLSRSEITVSEFVDFISKDK